MRVGLERRGSETAPTPESVQQVDDASTSEIASKTTFSDPGCFGGGGILLLSLYLV